MVSHVQMTSLSIFCSTETHNTWIDLKKKKKKQSTQEKKKSESTNMIIETLDSMYSEIMVIYAYE